jgi:hypothetical protein
LDGDAQLTSSAERFDACICAPRVSVVVLAYNEEVNLPACLSYPIAVLAAATRIDAAHRLAHSLL